MILEVKVLLGKSVMCRECDFPEASGRHMTVGDCSQSMGRACDHPEEHHKYRPGRRVTITPYYDAWHLSPARAFLGWLRQRLGYPSRG